MTLVGVYMNPCLLAGVILRVDSFEMDGRQFYVLFNSILVISGQCSGDNERMCAMEPCLQWERFLPQAGLEARTNRSVSQCLTH